MMLSLCRLLAITAWMSMSLVSASFISQSFISPSLAGDAKAAKSTKSVKAAKRPASLQSFAAAKVHRVAIHVDQNDPAVMNLALNNATNVFEYYRAKGEPVEVNIVTNGPGLHMLRDGSPVQDRIRQFKDLGLPGKMEFSACNNTRQAMEKREGKSIAILPEASLVSSGVVTLMELQEAGWSYVRP